MSLLLYNPFERCSRAQDPENAHELTEDTTRGTRIDGKPFVDEITITIQSLPRYLDSIEWKVLLERTFLAAAMMKNKPRKF